MNAIYFAASFSDKNGVNGGSHIDQALAIQEFMIVPTGAPTFAEALRIVSEVHHNLKSFTKTKYGQSAGHVGDNTRVVLPSRNWLPKKRPWTLRRSSSTRTASTIWASRILIPTPLSGRSVSSSSTHIMA
ncbi:hypothetical protein OXX79_000801 [Metschnikowia pulcherrima]